MNKVFVRLAVFALLVSLFLGGIWVWWKDATGSTSPTDNTTKIFVVKSGESVRTIATRLKNENLIRDQIGFFLLVKLLKLDDRLQAGDFRLSPSMDAKTIIDELTHGTLDVWVTTLEGWRVEEIALKLTQELSIPESEFLKYAREGYMFPDTYLLPKDASAAGVTRIFEDNFNQKMTADLKNGIKDQGLTFDEGVTLASIVEREGKSSQDRPVIAGILLNRLRDDHPLQVDATLQYVFGYQPEVKTWWKKDLSDQDKTVKSPYNTYANIGLPPNPIANPGLAALSAVAHPTKTLYWYYLHDKEGKAHYAETFEQHNANIEAYLR